MTTLQEERLAQFVNRTSEMARFCQMLDGASRSILVVWGDNGIGKSSLLAKMMHECSNRKIRKAEVVWTDTRNYDYLGVMRKIRDDFGAEHFQQFTDLTNFFTVERYELKLSYDGGLVSVGEGMKIENSNVKNITGVNFSIKDFNLVIPRKDMSVPEDERRIRLTDCFLGELKKATESELFVVFMDAIEKMTVDTDKWINGEFIRAISNGDLPQVRLIYSGQKKPELGECWMCADEAELKPLSRQHIIEYLAKRQITDEKEQNILALMLESSTGGRMSAIATLVEGYVQLRRKNLDS